eukprot:Skav201404  [mRNA]  locus=scaffold2219:53597:54772:- [translate_table: standard]
MFKEIGFAMEAEILELLLQRPRDSYELVGAPSRNRNVHNVISYLMVCFLIRWTILLVWAYKADVTFWPSEKQLMKLLYLPWERKWRERLSAALLTAAGWKR